MSELTNGEIAAQAWAEEGAADEAERCAKFMARFIVKEIKPEGEIS